MNPHVLLAIKFGLYLLTLVTSSIEKILVGNLVCRDFGLKWLLWFGPTQSFSMIDHEIMFMHWIHQLIESKAIRTLSPLAVYVSSAKGSCRFRHVKIRVVFFSCTSEMSGKNASTALWEREGSKNGSSLWIWTGGLPHLNVLSTYGTPLGCRCPGSDFVPIWDPPSVT